MINHEEVWVLLKGTSIVSLVVWYIPNKISSSNIFFTNRITKIYLSVALNLVFCLQYLQLSVKALVLDVRLHFKG